MTQRPEPYREFDNERIWNGLERLAADAEARSVDLATLALAWVLSHPDVTAVVVGPRRPEHLDPARWALELRLDPSERAEIASHFEPQ